MIRVLVTGCKGQVGQALVKRLHHSTELLALDRTDLDISNEKNVQKIIREFQPNFIINAAAYTAVDKAEDDAENAYAINRDGPQYLAQAAYDIDATLLHLSTDYVFSGQSKVAYCENDPTQPLSVYGKSKLAGEEAVRRVNPRHIILRTAWVFCEEGNNFVKTMLRLSNSRTKLSIVDDQRGGPTYAGDIANALISIVNNLSVHNDSNLYGTYHYTGAPDVSWFEFAQAIFCESERQGLQKAPELVAIPSVEFPTPAIRPKNSVLNVEKIYNNFGILPSDWLCALSKLDEFRNKL